MGSNSPVPEYQVKALFLVNFLKYVDWPPDVFDNDDAPFIIGLMGEDRFDNSLSRAVDGQKINNRNIEIRTINRGRDAIDCHMLFISSSENYRINHILERLAERPILTVGEDEKFIEKGGLINFLLRDERIRIEINLAASQTSGLQISSRLLSVAETVFGR